MKVSNEAIEAAAYALYLDANPDSEVQWFDITFHDQDELMRTATKVLEAAVPHVAAEAWDAAIDAAYERCVIGGITAEELKEANPYRSAE